MDRFRHVNPDHVIATAERLRKRVDERFPDSGLSGVAAELYEVARASAKRAHQSTKPETGLRIGIAILVALVLAGLVGVFASVKVSLQTSNVFELLQGIEAGVNDLVFLGLGIFFLASVETRRKRARILEATHELRALAHVIDMHQLTKDPDRALVMGPDTEGSPGRSLGRFELGRYLDYCSELLSLIGKIAALYAQSTTDGVSLAAVDQIEDLTSSLSSKIWLKILVLHQPTLRANSSD